MKFLQGDSIKIFSTSTTILLFFDMYYFIFFQQKIILLSWTKYISRNDIPVLTLAILYICESRRVLRTNVVSGQRFEQKLAEIRSGKREENFFGAVTHKNQVHNV